MNIKEIARAAGVSVATISRVLNHPEQVLPETREHVLAVMKEHHYTPNWFARGLNLRAKEGGCFGASDYACEFPVIPYAAFLPVLRDASFAFLEEEPLPDGYRPGDIVL